MSHTHSTTPIRLTTTTTTTTVLSPTPTSSMTTMNGVYISSYAILGNLLRVYVGRFMGGDCEDEAISAPHDNNQHHQFFSTRLCLTSDGRSTQTGGALFRDLPANMLGCFVLGLLTAESSSSSSSSSPPRPLTWLPADHSWQRHSALQAGWTVGFCGCLTTFSSWNTQMVTMMDGSYTVLGHQIPAALFGYVLGMMTALGSFRMGRLVAGWRRVSPSSDDGNEEEGAEVRHISDSPSTTITTTTNEPQRSYGVVHSFHFATLVLVALTLVGCVVSENQEFYQQLFGIMLVAPLGALSRWKLSYWNTHHPIWMGRPLPFSWMPWGTFLANTTGCLVSILCTGILDRYNNNNNNNIDNGRWPYVFLIAIRVGFAGSLSTVSTMIKEMVILQDKEPHSTQPTIYGLLSCLTGMTLGLVVYMLIVRIEP